MTANTYEVTSRLFRSITSSSRAGFSYVTFRALGAQEVLKYLLKE